MRKDNIKIKENITIIDKANATEEIVGYLFMDGEYTPYYKTMGVISAIAKCFVDGVEFEENDLIFDCVMSDKELNHVVFDEFLNNKDKSDEYTELMSEVLGYVEDKVAYLKQKSIHGTRTIDLIGEFLEFIVPAINGLANLDLKELTPEVIEFGKKFIEKINNGDITDETITNSMKSVISELRYDTDKK